MNWKWNTNQNFNTNFYNPTRYANNKTYWENLTAPLTEGEKFLRFWGCFLYSFIIIVNLVYKFRTDVEYVLQFQLTFISNKYYELTSNELCLILIIVLTLGLAIRRWWYWFGNNFWLTALLIAKNKMFHINLYKQAMFNGIIMTREYFNFSCNFYLFKRLTPEQIKYAVQEEFNVRYNSVSFLTYKDCRYGFVKDPWIEQFFNDFHLDWADSHSYERIRSQIDIYQINKLAWGQQDMNLRDLEIIRDHPINYYYDKYSLGFVDFLDEYIGWMCLGTIAGVIVFSALWYNLVEDPTIRNNIVWYYNKLSGISNIPTIEPVEIVAPIVDIFSSKIVYIFGQDNPEEYIENLQLLLAQNAGLIKSFNESPFVAVDVIKSLGPELAQKAYESFLPKTINQMLPQMLETQTTCLDLVEKIAENMTNSPFEQFEVIILQRISFFGLDFSISNLTLYLGLSLAVIVVLSSVISKSLSLIPNYWQSVIEIFYTFIFSMLVDQAGKKAKVFFPAIFSVFFFILVSNLLGLIPLSFAVTSHVVITFCLGFGFFVAWVIVAFKTIGLKVFNIFWPTNVPLWLRPLLMVVEILSFSLRPFSLSIRLFVNMLAGHVLLHLVGGSVVLVFSKAAIFSFIPFILLLAVFCLELGIAFLQAYIFSILLCIYLHDSYHVHGH